MNVWLLILLDVSKLQVGFPFFYPTIYNTCCYVEDLYTCSLTTAYTEYHTWSPGPLPDWPPSCYLGSHTMYQHFTNTIYRERNRHRHLNFSTVQLTALPRLLQLLDLQPHCWWRYWVLTNGFGYSQLGRGEQRRRELKHPYSCLTNFVPIFYSR